MCETINLIVICHSHHRALMQGPSQLEARESLLEVCVSLTPQAMFHQCHPNFSGHLEWWGPLSQTCRWRS